MMYNLYLFGTTIFMTFGYKTNHGPDYMDFKNKHIIIINDIINISYIIQYLQEKINSNKIKYLKILIFSNYFLIWLYIIIISLSYSKIDYEFIIHILESLKNSLDSFENNPHNEEENG